MRVRSLADPYKREAIEKWRWGRRKTAMFHDRSSSSSSFFFGRSFNSSSIFFKFPFPWDAIKWGKKISANLWAPVAGVKHPSKRKEKRRKSQRGEKEGNKNSLSDRRSNSGVQDFQPFCCVSWKLSVVVRDEKHKVQSHDPPCIWISAANQIPKHWQASLQLPVVQN